MNPSNRICPYCNKGNVWYIDKNKQALYGGDLYCKECGKVYSTSVKPSNVESIQWQDAGAGNIKCPICEAVFSDELFCMGKNTMGKDDIKYCPGCGIKIGYKEYFG